jgi:putative transposase
MSPSEKVDILARVENRSGCKRKVLAELGISRSTYYRWRQGQNEAKRRVRPWNRITPNEKRRTLAVALEFPELSSRQLSAWITDHEGFAVSESTVYRILRREGRNIRRFSRRPPGNTTPRTTRPHQMWATDASYFRVVGWGYYYLVTVMDDYSRFILGWKLQRDMSANSLIEAVQAAVDATGMTDVPVENRTRLLSDNGAGYVSRAFPGLFEPGGDWAYPGSTLPPPD